MDVIVAMFLDKLRNLLDFNPSRTKRKYAFLYMDSLPLNTHPLAGSGQRTVQR